MTDASLLAERAGTILCARHHKTLQEANAAQLHEALSLAAMEQLTPLWIQKEAERCGKRQAYYLSAEYLMGRMIYNNLYCLGILEDVRSEMKARGADLSSGPRYHGLQLFAHYVKENCASNFQQTWSQWLAARQNSY